MQAGMSFCKHKGQKILSNLLKYEDPPNLNVNPFTLRVPQESIVCYFHTFENNLEIKQILTKYLKESCW